MADLNMAHRPQETVGALFIFASGEIGPPLLRRVTGAGRMRAAGKACAPPPRFGAVPICRYNARRRRIAGFIS